MLGVRLGQTAAVERACEFLLGLSECANGLEDLRLVVVRLHAAFAAAHAENTAIVVPAAVSVAHDFLLHHMPATRTAECGESFSCPALMAATAFERSCMASSSLA